MRMYRKSARNVAANKKARKVIVAQERELLRKGIHKILSIGRRIMI
jgi:hypothetical protein